MISKPQIKSVGISEEAKGEVITSEDASRLELENTSLLTSKYKTTDEYFSERSTPIKKGLGIQIDIYIWQWLDNTNRGCNISKVELVQKALEKFLPDSFRPNAK